MQRLPGAHGIDIEDWDITKARPNELGLSPELVFHLAAAKDAPEGEVDPEKVMRINALGTANVLARWPDAHVVLASTCKACEPETAYGASKLIAERLVLNAGGSVARFHNVRETSGNVFETWARLDAGASASAVPSSLPVTACHRYFISRMDALHLLTTVPFLPPGRYMIHPGKLRWMPDVAAEEYPGRPWHYINPRRGDRLREPMVAKHERLDTTDYDRILKVTSPHD